ncbi:MAG: hypothetical protein LBD59_06835 [Prevotellaceae bacterium]|jgi:hypothetical protein|nr:hypothetical protein [Prevotellaceae bacterium]
MKKQALLLGFLFIVAGLLGQEQKKYYLSYGKVSYSTKRVELTNSEDYSGKNYFALSLDYAYRTSENMEFVTGLSAAVVEMDFTAQYHWHNYSSYTYGSTFYIFSLPLGIRHYFGRYFNASGWISVNYHPHKGYTWGGGGFVISG